jgi:hypothetical protein
MKRLFAFIRCWRFRGRGILRPLWQDESGLAGLLKLQLLANFHLLLTAAAFQTADAVFAMLDFAGKGGVLLLKLTDFAMLFEQRLQPLRSAYGDQGINDHDSEQDQCSFSSHRGLAKLL